MENTRSMNADEGCSKKMSIAIWCTAHCCFVCAQCTGRCPLYSRGLLGVSFLILVSVAGWRDPPLMSDLKFDTFFFFEATHERKSSSHIQQSSRNQTRNKVQNKKLRTRTPRLYEPCHIEHLWAATSCWQGVHNSAELYYCLLYTSPSPRDGLLSRMPSSA